MSRSHEGHDDKQHIVRGITHSYQISSAYDDSMDTNMTPKFIYLTLIVKAYEGRDDIWHTSL